MTTTFRFLTTLLLFFTLSGCAQVQPTATSDPSPAAASSPMAVHSPTVPPTPTQESIYLGPLDQEQRVLLNQAALSYVSETPKEAIETARKLGHIKENGTAEMVCGPLSLAILQKAGLVDAQIPLVDFFYLNPRPEADAYRLEKAFPSDRFEKLVQEQSISQIDYTKFPLYPGDFLYLFAGDSGSFEHMLVVSRVDETGRAYSVTNIRTAEGIVIKEVMLYDPNDPGIGQFYDWTNREYMDLGRTGYGGFWLWRLKSPLP